MTPTPAVQATGLTKRYGKLTAVDSLDLTIEPGEIVALLGPNGAGKSTATEMILGLTKPDAGSVTVFGAAPVPAVRSGDVGAMLQNGALLAETCVSSLLKLYHSVCAHPLPLDEVIQKTDLGPILANQTQKLSGGQAQRVRLALALMANPRLILLDEPTVGIDVEGRRRFWSTMRDFASTGRTVIFATHYLEEADEFAQRVVVMQRGRVVADGSGAQIKQTVAGRLVSFATDQPHDWAAIPGVTAIDDTTARISLRTKDSDATARAVLALEGVRDLEITAPSLEDAFVQLTHEEEGK